MSRYSGIAGCASVPLTSTSEFVDRLRKGNVQKGLKLIMIHLRLGLGSRRRRLLKQRGRWIWERPNSMSGS